VIQFAVAPVTLGGTALFGHEHQLGGIDPPLQKKK
jgi:hypothetical protein